jgi:roadblock/LC7 domain-containing protein
MIEGSHRRAVSVTALSMAVLFFVPGLCQARIDDGIQLKFWGGAGYHILSNLNDGLRGWNDGLEASPYAHIREGAFGPLHLGMETGGELIVNIGPRWAIGLGTGYLGVGRDDTRTVEYGEPATATTIYQDHLRTKARVIPIRLAGYWKFSSSSKISWSASAGMGYYFGSLDWDYQAGDYHEMWTGTSGVFGFHGEIAFEYRFLKGLAFVIEAGGMNVRFNNLSGDLLRNGESVNNAVLWSFEGGAFPFLEISAGKPSGASGEIVREAVIDLSGIVFRLGFKVLL